MRAYILGALVFGVVAYAVRRVVLLPWDKSQPLTLAEQRKQSLSADGPMWVKSRLPADRTKLAIPVKVKQRALRRVS